MFKFGKYLLATACCCAVSAAQLTQANVLRDPMRPENHTPAKPGVTRPLIKKAPLAPQNKLELSAITYTVDAPKRSAIINDMWVKHGSIVNGATVLHIGSNSVELDRNGKKITVQLLPPIKLAPES